MSAAVLAPAPTVAQARRAAADRLRERGFDTPDLDARLLVGHALGLDHAALVVQSVRRLTAAEAESLDALLARRLAHEPVARILGTREFWSLPLRITPDVLVPRPETETVVEAVLTVAERGRPLRIADLGVGSDRDANVLGVGRDNARRLGLASRAGFVACDFGAALAGGCDIVVSNPPYVRTPDIAT